MKGFFFVISICISFVCFSEIMTITYRGPESENDKRMEYPLALLTEALDITKSEYGDYKLVPSIRMNSKRAQTPEVIDKIENYIVEASVSNKIEDELLSVKIPTTKGLYGYRLLLIDSHKQSLFKNIKNIEGLKNIKFGQGSKWLDTKILNSAGLDVVTGLNYKGLLKMLMSGRFDAFPRGVNEIFKEISTNRSEYVNLVAEDSICIYYPLPKFFYTSKKSLLLNERVSKGLSLMLDNGTFDKIWVDFNNKYIVAAKLNERTIIRLENNFLSDIVPLNDPKYWYVPEHIIKTRDTKRSK